MARYIKFFNGLRESPSDEVSVLAHIVARGVRTNTGNNLQHVQEMSGLDPWSCFGFQVKKVMNEKLAQLPQPDEWRLPCLGK